MMDQQNNNNSLEKNFNKPRNFIITGIITLVIAVSVIIYRFFEYADLDVEKNLKFVLNIVSDGFFVSGVLVGGIGLLILISGEGVFDILSYGFGILLKAFSRKEDHESFRDYKLRKMGERKDVKISFIAIVGGISLLIALICSLPFMKL